MIARDKRCLVQNHVPAPPDQRPELSAQERVQILSGPDADAVHYPGVVSKYRGSGNEIEVCVTTRSDVHGSTAAGSQVTLPPEPIIYGNYVGMICVTAAPAG